MTKDSLPAVKNFLTELQVQGIPALDKIKMDPVPEMLAYVALASTRHLQNATVIKQAVNSGNDVNDTALTDLPANDRNEDDMQWPQKAVRAKQKECALLAILHAFCAMDSRNVAGIIRRAGFRIYKLHDEQWSDTLISALFPLEHLPKGSQNQLRRLPQVVQEFLVQLTDMTSPREPTADGIQVSIRSV